MFWSDFVKLTAFTLNTTDNWRKTVPLNCTFWPFLDLNVCWSQSQTLIMKSAAAFTNQTVITSSVREKRTKDSDISSSNRKHKDLQMLKVWRLQEFEDFWKTLLALLYYLERVYIFFLITRVFSYSPKACLLVSDSKLATGVNVSVNSFLSLCVSPAIEQRPVRSARRLSPCDSQGINN